MARRFLCYLGVICCLSGCLLNQQAPNPQPNPMTGSGLVGFVGMEEVRGAGTAAGINAIFGRQTASHRAWGVMSHHYFGMPEAVERDATTVGAGQCAVSASAAPQPSPSTQCTSCVDVGKLVFGIALQNTFFPFEESQDHQYTQTLPLDFPAGAYEVDAEGAGDIPAFGGVLSIPESLKGVTANGVAFESAPLKLKRSETLSIAWQAPTVPSAASQLMLEVDTQSGSQLVTLQCNGVENDFLQTASGSSVRWDIPASVLSPLALTSSAKIFFVRGALRTMQTAVQNLPVALKFQGLRTYFTQAELDE